MIFILNFLFYCSSIVLAFNPNINTNVAVYWGQNSAGSQASLASYCQSSDTDIIILSFLNNFPSISLNFADACTETFSDSTLLHCPTIAADIKTCQNLGKKVLLSLGGASGSYGFASENEAKVFAQTLWDTFGEGTGTSERPFDSAIIDGFDFDIENNENTGYATLVNELRSLFADGSKQYYISAAPQCPYPDASVGNLLSNADVDFAFIQFYNNYCNVDKQFNWDTWKNFAETISPNKNIKLFLGLPAAQAAAGSGYIGDLEELETVINQISSTANFGGISLWDASQAFSNIVSGKTYISHVKNILQNLSSIPIESATQTEITSINFSITHASSTFSSISSSKGNFEETETPSALLSDPRSTIILRPSSDLLTASTTSTSATSLSISTSPIAVSSSNKVTSTSSDMTASSDTLEISSHITSTLSAPSFSTRSTLLPNLAKTSTLNILPMSKISTSSTYAKATVALNDFSSSVTGTPISSHSSGTYTSKSSGLSPITTTLAPSLIPGNTLEGASQFSSSIKRITGSSSAETTTLTPIVSETPNPADKQVILTTLTASTETAVSIVPTTATASTVSATLTTTAQPTLSSDDTPAHAIAKQLNQYYSESKFNGKSFCTDGELACTADGQFSVCNFGSWVSRPCAEGTTCYAYDSDDAVITQCSFNELKANFI